MKIQYFMKGLGMGIILTSLVLLVAFGKPNTIPRLEDQVIIDKAKELGMVTQNEYLNKELTDEQIIEQGKGLGMVTSEEYSSKVLPEEQIVELAQALGMVTSEEFINKTLTKEEIILKAKELEMYTKQEYSNKKISDDQIIQKAKELGMIFMSSQVENPGEEQTGETGTVVVTKGMTSIEISMSLQQNGIVDDWTVFEKYLEKNGLNGLMRTGTFIIEKGTTFEVIAKILTKS